MDYTKLIPKHADHSIRKHWRVVMMDRVEAYLLHHKRIGVSPDGSYDFRELCCALNVL